MLFPGFLNKFFHWFCFYMFPRWFSMIWGEQRVPIRFMLNLFYFVLQMKTACRRISFWFQSSLGFWFLAWSLILCLNFVYTLFNFISDLISFLFLFWFFCGLKFMDLFDLNHAFEIRFWNLFMRDNNFSFREFNSFFF